MTRAHGVGSRIRRRRQELGLTQEQLAALIGVSSASVMRWELGRNFPARHQGALEAALRMRLDPDDPGDQLQELASAWRHRIQTAKLPA